MLLGMEGGNFRLRVRERAIHTHNKHSCCYASKASLADCSRDGERRERTLFVLLINQPPRVKGCARVLLHFAQMKWSVDEWEREERERERERERRGK